ncbi:substrate-binding domain-containing protein [Jannaschia sp. M317]|uniref:substrate-binding domain-containing protein n=1 Tax=Jannaschia sp. M317 TaxID=2867011 RepID=UPI0021A92C10|nr:substrate-binding domain-containing protein [Jannaschia sp. M317]UWQ16554.1 substrate-binding domain-containing protein [Jannaschia sp. M317]
MIRVLVLLCLALPVRAEDMRMAVTTSFENSGLAEVLLPAARQALDLDVRLIVVGTGQALRLGAAGDVDAVLVHSLAAEQAWLAQGHGTTRTEIMSNDFILIGPAADPAGVSGSRDIETALTRIATAGAPFLSRGDDSGTHKTERGLWPAPPSGAWYRETGSGMGSTLNVAAAMGGYVLTDRGSWLNFGNKGDLVVLHQGDAILLNTYAYLPVNPDKHPAIKALQATRFGAWLTSDEARGLINGYRIDGQPLFRATQP